MAESINDAYYCNKCDHSVVCLYVTQGCEHC